MYKYDGQADPRWTITFDYPKRILWLEIGRWFGLCSLSSATAVFVYLNELSPSLPYYLTLAAGFFGFQLYKCWVWFSGNFKIISANEIEMQLRDPRVKLAPARTTPWQDIKRIELDSIVMGADVNRRIRSLVFLNFVLKIPTGEPYPRVLIDLLDRPVEDVVDELVAKSGARSVAEIDLRLRS